MIRSFYLVRRLPDVASWAVTHWNPTTRRDEMDDHKMYYDPRDLWPLLVEAGFLPHAIRIFRHKVGLNTFAICRR